MICSTSTESARTVKSGMHGTHAGILAALTGAPALRNEYPDERTRTQGMSDSQKRSVDDHRRHHAPERDAQQQRSIGQQQFRRASSACLLMHQVQVAEDPVERKWNREPQQGGP